MRDRPECSRIKEMKHRGGLNAVRDTELDSEPEGFIIFLGLLRMLLGKLEKFEYTL